MNVTIDGIQYVPATNIPVVSDWDRLQAVKELVTALYLYAPDRGSRGCISSALRRLSPDLYELAMDNVGTAMDAVEALEEQAQGGGQ